MKINKLLPRQRDEMLAKISSPKMPSLLKGRSLAMSQWEMHKNKIMWVSVLEFNVLCD